MLWKALFKNDGVVNTILTMLGFESINFLADKNWALFIICLLRVWQFGSAMVLFLAALKGVPEDLYEAAEIDGAGRLRRFINVTLPQVKEMTFVMCVTTVTGAFLVFNDVYILTGGGPGNASTTLAVYMYKNGFALDKMGYASTIAVGMLIISMILALIQNRAFGSGKED